jgi:hypothetical protein
LALVGTGSFLVGTSGREESGPVELAVFAQGLNTAVTGTTVILRGGVLGLPGKCQSNLGLERVQRSLSLAQALRVPRGGAGGVAKQE